MTNGDANSGATACDLEVVDRHGYRATCARRPFHAGEPVFTVTGPVTGVPTAYTIQVAAGCHVQPAAGRYVNHSCAPNCSFDSRARAFRALRPIASGEEITFDYNTTERELAAPFRCRCGAGGCVGDIRGHRYLSDAQQQRLAPLTAAHLRHPPEDL